MSENRRLDVAVREASRTSRYTAASSERLVRKPDAMDTPAKTASADCEPILR